MSLANLKDQLLGLSMYEPPASLREGARFRTADGYRAFLDDIVASPERYFAGLAKELRWTIEPTGVGEPKNWFPGGRLNLAQCCLERDSGSDEPIIMQQGGAERDTLHVSKDSLYHRVLSVAKALWDLGLQPSDHVLVVAECGLDMVVSSLACLRLGLIAVPISAERTDERIRTRYQATSCRAAVFSPRRAVPAGIPKDRLLVLSGREQEPGAAPAPVHVDSMHTAFMIADTAGELSSTPSAGFLIHAISTYRWLLDGRGPGDRLWMALPPGYTSTVSASLGALAVSAPIGFFDDETTTDLPRFLEAIAAAKPRVLLSCGNAVAKLVSAMQKLSTLPRIKGPSLFVVDAESLEPRVWHALRDDLFDGSTHVVQVLSRPEAGGFVAGPHPAAIPVRPSSVSLPAPGFDGLVVGAQGEECAPSVGGLFALRRAVPSLARELQGIEPPITLQVKARIDRMGYIWPMGETRVERPKEEKVAIPKLEALIAGLSSVDQVAIVRYVDPEGIVRTRAFIVLQEGAKVDVDTVSARIAEAFGAGAMPDGFQFVPQLPYSRTGKLLRSILRRVSAGEPLAPEETDLVVDPQIVEQLGRKA